MPGDARGKLSLTWCGLMLSYAAEWSMRPVKDMSQVKRPLCQLRLLPPLPGCQCMQTASYLAPKMILTTMQDPVAFKSHPPVQMVKRLQGFQELSAVLTPAM